MNEFVNNIKPFIKLKGKLNSFITLLIYDQNSDNVIKFIDQKIKSVNNIKDNYKKQKILDKLYLIKNNISEYKENYFSKSGILYLVNDDKMDKFELNKNVLKVIREEFSFNIFYQSDDYFYVEYIIDMLTNFEFKNLLLLDNKKAYLYNINKNKTKLIHTTNKLDNDEINSAIKNKFNGDYILGGNGNFKNSFVKNNSNNILGDLKVVSFKPDRIDNIKEEALDLYLEFEENHTITKLKEYTTNMVQYDNLLLYNNNRILKFLENCLIKTLIIHKKSPIYEQVQELDLDSIDYFELTSNNNDCKEFLNNYQGAIAEMRYEMAKESFDYE